MRILLSIFIAVLLSSDVAAQQLNLPMNRENNLWIDRGLSQVELLTQSSFKPLVTSSLPFDSLQGTEDQRWKRKTYSSYVMRKLRNESFIVADTGDFRLAIDPLFDFELGTDLAAATRKTLTKNTRGLLVRGSITERLSFETSFYETQAFFPGYIDNYIQENREEYFENGVYKQATGFGLIPGQGRAKPFKDGGYDYAIASGYASYSPSGHFNFQLGHGKHFIGEGYRSMLLSDNAFNYPYARITSTFLKGRIQYTNLYTSFQQLTRLPGASTPEAPFERKGGTFHYLSLAPAKWLQIGLFEGVIWQTRDSSGTLPFDYNYLNPVIFVNSGVFGFDSFTNALIGATIRLNPFKNFVLYGQYAWDDDSPEKIGMQAGFKAFDLFTVKNLGFQAEINTASYNTYSHQMELQSFTHYNQPLAHPLGGNFNEFVSFIDYRWRDFFTQLRVNYAVYDKTIDMVACPTCYEGFDVINGGIYESTVTYQDFKLGYVINPQTNMNILMGIVNRSEQYANTTTNTQYVYVGLRTSLRNIYYDF